MIDQLIKSGNDAELVLANPAFKSAMEQMRSDVTEQWKACPIRDREGQMLLLQLAKLTDKFESLFVSRVNAGNYEKKKLELDNLRNESKPRQILRRVING